MRTLIYILAGYLSGSVLYARIFAQLLKKGDICGQSRDGNPGSANAFMYGGFWCGAMTLCADLLKGIIPVHFYLSGSNAYINPYALALVIAAPVIGHIYPVFYNFKGGKGIAVTFGSLLGLVPDWTPALALAIFFIFFSLVLRIVPHFYRTLVTYASTFVYLFFTKKYTGIFWGFAIILAAVTLHMHRSTEKRERLQVKFLWMH